MTFKRLRVRTGEHSSDGRRTDKEAGQGFVLKVMAAHLPQFSLMFLRRETLEKVLQVGGFKDNWGTLL